MLRCPPLPRLVPTVSCSWSAVCVPWLMVPCGHLVLLYMLHEHLFGPLCQVLMTFLDFMEKLYRLLIAFALHILQIVHNRFAALQGVI